MTKRQAIVMCVVALITQAIVGFGFHGCVLGLATGALTAKGLGSVLNANYRVRRIWK